MNMRERRNGECEEWHHIWLEEMTIEQWWLYDWSQAGEASPGQGDSQWTSSPSWLRRHWKWRNCQTFASMGHFLIFYILFWLMGNVRCDDLQHYQQAVSSHQELPRIHSLDSQQSGPTVQGGGSLADCKAMGWSVPKGFAWVSYMKGKRDSIPAGVEGWLTFKHYQWLQSGLGASRFLASYSSTWNKGTQISY